MGWHGRTAFCQSGPLLALVGAGFGIGIVISFSSKWRKMVSSKENCYPIEDDDGYKKDDRISQLADGGKKGEENRISQLPADGGIKEEEDRISQLPAEGGKKEKEDRISQLPNDLLSEILSRLPMPEAVRTSILARRWRNVWAQRPTLVLSCSHLCGGMTPHPIPRMHRFMNAVDQTLRFTSSHRIKYARICCCFAKKIPSDFSRWVQHLVSSGATELFFRFFCPGFCVSNSFAFPFDLLFQAVSLKHLHLFYCSIKPSFKGHFRSLEHLELSTVALHNREIPNILSSCVNLQRLVLRDCKLPTDLYISGPYISLKFLEMDTCYGVRMIDVKAVNLTTFICFSFDNIEYKLSCVPKLEQISVRYCGAGMVPYIFGDVAECCPEIKTMLCQTWIEEIQDPPVKISLLHKLVQLELLMFFRFRVDLINIIPILGACPVLEKLHLLVLRPRISGERPETSWPNLCYRHLKEVKYSGFYGLRNEIEFASFLVRSAPMLEQMLIQPYYEYYDHCRTWLMERVSSEIDTEKGRIICDELARKAVSSRVEVRYGRNYIDNYTKPDHRGRFVPIFSQ